MSTSASTAVSVHGSATEQNATLHAVRQMKSSDLADIVAWHSQSFSSAFYSQLGHGFLRHWFTSHMNAPGSVSLTVSDSSGYLVGYLIGTTDQSAASRGSWQTGYITGLRGACALLARPSMWVSFLRVRAGPYAVKTIRQILRPRKGKVLSSGDGQLMYICMAPSHRCLGAGSVLLEAFVGEARRSGATRLTLVTETENVSAQRFCIRHGWTINSKPAQAMDGRPLTRMELNLGEDAI